MPSLLHPLAITSMWLIPAAHASLPLDDPALAEDLKTYIASLDPTKPEDCIGFVNRHLSDILYTRFTHKSVLEDELARMKSTHATACLRNKTLKGISKDQIQARGGRARLPVVGALGMGDEGQAVSSEAFPRRQQGCCPRCRSGARRESAADRIRLRARNTPGVRRAHSVRSAGRASGRIL